MKERNYLIINQFYEIDSSFTRPTLPHDEIRTVIKYAGVGKRGLNCQKFITTPNLISYCEAFVMKTNVTINCLILSSGQLTL